MSHHEHDEHVVHDTDFERVRKNLSGLYGKVAAYQNAAIAAKLLGPRVLDAGAGAGKLAHDLTHQGFEVQAIDIDPHAIEFAKTFHGITVEERSIYETGYEANSFDSVVFRESVFHLDFERVLKEVDRVCGKRVVIFESNSRNPLLRLGRKLVGHEEYNEQPPQYYATLLEQHGYRVEGVNYLDACLVPLSGGLLTRPLPFASTAGRALLRLNSVAERTAERVGANRMLCWRYLIWATKT